MHCDNCGIELIGKQKRWCELCKPIGQRAYSLASYHRLNSPERLAQRADEARNRYRADPNGPAKVKINRLRRVLR